jgi:hypothetical protein
LTKGADVQLDTAVIQTFHTDRSGVNTTAHEAYHADGARLGMSGEELQSQDQPAEDGGPSEAEAFGASVASEAPDITENEAEALLQILFFQGSQPPQ